LTIEMLARAKQGWRQARDERLFSHTYAMS